MPKRELTLAPERTVAPKLNVPLELTPELALGTTLILQRCVDAWADTRRGAEHATLNGYRSWRSA